MDNYYQQKLNSQKLFEVYNTSIPRIKQYLNAEIEFVKQNITKDADVLELGAGYGRIVKELAPFCHSIIGLEISAESVELGNQYLENHPQAALIAMDVHQIELDKSFDLILCLQNGLSSMRITNQTLDKIFSHLKPGGKALISTYSSDFWPIRLKWFEEQAAKGLLGAIDYEQTKNGIIVCDDGFKATTHSLADLEKIGKSLGFSYKVIEIDNSSLFLIIEKD